MSEEIQLAITLLLIGMITVFVILTLVVIGGKILIAAVNRFGSGVRSAQEVESAQDEEITVVVLAAVVEHITSGKGAISSIEKLK